MSAGGGALPGGARPICIFGGGGFAKEVYFLARDCGFSVASFLDLRAGGELFGVPIEAIDRFDPARHAAVVAVGDPRLRRKIVLEIGAAAGAGVEFPRLVHPSVKIAPERRVEIGDGAVICAGCVLTCDIVIGRWAQLNLATTVGHDVRAGDFLTTAPGVHINGRNRIGERVYLGSNAATIDRITIADDAVIGAGACVVRDIDAPGTYVGVPARRRGDHG